MPQHNTKYAAYTKQAHKHTGRNFRARVCVCIHNLADMWQLCAALHLCAALRPRPFTFSPSHSFSLPLSTPLSLALAVLQVLRLSLSAFRFCSVLTSVLVGRIFRCAFFQKLQVKNKLFSVLFFLSA